VGISAYRHFIYPTAELCELHQNNIFITLLLFFFCLTGLLSLVSDTTAADLSLMGFNSGERLNFIFGCDKYRNFTLSVVLSVYFM
jgi:hypothetical protein